MAQAAPEPMWVHKFFGGDRLAREALTLLAPEFTPADLALMDAHHIGPYIAELGDRLYEEGCLPGLPTWELEESPEVMESIQLWKEAMKEPTTHIFNKKVQKAAEQADAGYLQMGNLAPRMSSLRWSCCMRWLAARSEAVEACSAGGALGTVSVELSKQASHEAKSWIFERLHALLSEPPVLAIFDYDLLGEGCWHGGRAGKEPLPVEAKQEWFRRGFEFDTIMLCHQIMNMPPAELNPSAPTIFMVRPYGEQHIHLLPPKAPRLIIERNFWNAVMTQASLEDLHTRVRVEGEVLHMEVAPPATFDFDDPDIIAKLQRGEDLGKGHQEEGLPGAIHGSIGLMYAAMCTVEGVVNVHFYPGLLELDGFVQSFLRYGPPLRSLDFSGCSGTLGEGILELLPLAGESLTVLDLSDCGLDGTFVETLIQSLVELTGLRHLDLGGNALNAQATVRLISALSEGRIDIASVRLDGNPFGNSESLRNEVAAQLATRGEQVVAGGELVFSLGDNAVRWCAEPRQGQLAQRLRDEGSEGPRTMSFKELRQATEARRRKLDKMEQQDPEYETLPAKAKWLSGEREKAKGVLESNFMQMYKKELQVAVERKEAQKAALAESFEASVTKDGEAAGPASPGVSPSGGRRRSSVRESPDAAAAAAAAAAVAASPSGRGPAADAAAAGSSAGFANRRPAPVSTERH